MSKNKSSRDEHLSKVPMEFQPSRLQVSTAGNLLALIRQHNLQMGDKLGEEILAQQLGVSRTSVRGALRVLELRKIVAQQPRRGYRLLKPVQEIEGDVELPSSRDETLYMQIARERLAGKLPDSFTETDLMRRYGAGRHLVLAALALLSKEGVVQRGQGREWQFHDILKSKRAREQSYEFRLMLEPSAMRLPTFKIVKPLVMKSLASHRDLLSTSGQGLSSRDLFQIDASFHELLASFSGNEFVFAAISQQNRLRRLLEYQSYQNAARVRSWCLEHISVLEALLAGDRELAATNLAKHLGKARRIPPASQGSRSPSRRSPL